MEANDLMELYDLIDSEYSSTRPSPLHAFIMVPSVDVKDLEQIAQVRRRKIRLIPTQSPKLYEIRLGIRNRHVNGWLVLSKSYWLILIQPSESSREAGHIGESWLSGMFPALAFARITTLHLADIVEEMNRLENSEVRVLSFVLRREGQKEEYRNTTKSWEGYEKFDRRRMLAYAKSANKLVDAIHFRLMVNAKEVFEASLSRSGHLIFYSGSETGFSEFLRVAVSRVTEYAFNELKRFTGLESKPEDNFKVNTISYGATDDYTFDRDVENLMRALAKTSAYSVSLEHSGNPWFSLHAIDRGDGSVYDLHVFAHRLDVVPLNKAEATSTTRLTGLVEGVFPFATRTQPQLA